MTMLIDRLFAYLDKKAFLGIHIWDFGFHSLTQKYTRLFLLKAVLRYPARALKGIQEYRKFLKTQRDIHLKYRYLIYFPDENIFLKKKEERRASILVGLGFCLKPFDPGDLSLSCPSGRPNHDCIYLEKGEIQEICLECSIREISQKCLETGWSVYIMTSAEDIARDFLLPQIEKGQFPQAILLLCPYSAQAIIPALAICGASSCLLAYSSGFCRNFREWYLADGGYKPEMTAMSLPSREMLFELLSRIRAQESSSRCFLREGNIFYSK